MQVQVMGHDGSSDNADRNIQRLFSGQAGNEADGYFTQRGLGKEDLDQEGQSDNGDEPDDEDFHSAHPQALKEQQEKSVQHGDADAIDQGQARQQLDTDGHSQYLRQV